MSFLFRTYFLYIIANQGELRYSVYSSMTSCLKVFATAFARPAHIVIESYETRCEADVDRTSGEPATTCLPSRLSRVRASSPALKLSTEQSSRFSCHSTVTFPDWLYSISVILQRNQVKAPEARCQVISILVGMRIPSTS